MIPRHGASAPSKLRVRTGKGYPFRYTIDLGQRNAEFTRGPLCPLTNPRVLRLLPWLRATDALTILPPVYDLIHSKNAIPVLTRTPFIVTFEDYLPRVPEDRSIIWLERWLQDQLMSDQCIALLAESHYGLRQFRWQNRNSPNLARLNEKVEVLYPALIPYREVPKKPSSTLKLLFVGADFLRKGGPAVVRAHDRLKQAGIPVSTTVISSLRWSARDYIGPPSERVASAEHDRVRRGDIAFYPALKNSQVLKIMRDADYLLLPTFHDTFGYVAIEALACGTPVIATDTCAQPEIIEDGVCGFLLPFDKEPGLGRWAWIHRTKEPGYVEAFLAEVERLADAIVDRLARCWEDRGRYEELSAQCLRRVDERFNLERARHRLEALYEGCRARNV
jgi:glycosyltransferase involved in cell wall biosynthesis